MWKNDYLLSLRERTQTSLKHSKKQSPNLPQVGDVVLIKEDLPRGRWKIGRIQELVKGKDQLIQSAKVLISPKRFLHRPLSLLYPIECPEEKVIRDDHEKLNCHQVASRNDDSVHGDPELDITNGNTTIPKADLSPTTKRPVRQATLSAKRKLKEWLNPSEHFISLGSVAICIANDVMIT